jgi:hypothetical protein
MWGIPKVGRLLVTFESSASFAGNALLVLQWLKLKRILRAQMRQHPRHHATLPVSPTASPPTLPQAPIPLSLLQNKNKDPNIWEELK